MLATLPFVYAPTSRSLLTVGELRFFAATMEIKKSASTECSGA